MKTSHDPNVLHFITQPRCVGYWRTGDGRFASRERPGWLTRTLMRWLLEWTWEDA